MTDVSPAARTATTAKVIFGTGLLATAAAPVHGSIMATLVACVLMMGGGGLLVAARRAA